MRSPWHLWVVGAVTLLWHAGGAYDHLMWTIRSPGYLEMIPQDLRPGYIAHMDAMPLWASATWALGVWGALLGSVLILARSRLAAPAFAAAILGFLMTSAYTFLIAAPSPFTMLTPATALFTLAIVIVLFGAFAYARRQSANGVLR